MLDKQLPQNVEYLIMDESHYFMTDSGFSTVPSFLLKNIPRVFAYSKRVYISATIDDVLPYICKYEALAGSANFKIRHGWKPDFEHILRICDREVREKEIRRGLYSPLFPTPILYSMPQNYDFINLNFFEDDMTLIDKINKSVNKWLVFVTSKEKGKELATKIKGAIFIDASTKENDPDYIDSLIDNEKFENKVLISTSVFINGNNLVDDELCSIVIYQVDETSIKQGLGRKRISRGSNENIEVYLKIPSKKMLNQYLKNAEDALDIVEKSDNNPSYLSRFLLSNAYNVEMIKKMLYVDKKGGLHFAELCVENLKNDIVRFKNMLALLDGGVHSYCREIAAYFKLEFDEKMVEMLATFDNVVAEYEKRMLEMSPVDETRYRTNISELNKIKRRFGRYDKRRDNDGKNRPTMLPKTYNQRMQEVGSSLRVREQDSFFYYYLEE